MNFDQEIEITNVHTLTKKYPLHWKQIWSMWDIINVKLYPAQGIMRYTVLMYW